jgi:hypothetical protein
MGEKKYQIRSDNPHPLSTRKTELIREGKYDEYGNRREVNIAVKVPNSGLRIQPVYRRLRKTSALQRR